MEKAINDEMSEKERNYESIRLMEIALKAVKKKWLTGHGWKERCDFVDSYWRWCKVVEGKMMMCGTDEAINIEYNYLT